MSSFRKWYGMRKGMTERGAWKHRVPAQEEGEPPTKKPKGLESESAGDRADPEEGTSRQAQEDLSKYYFYIFQNGWVWIWIKWMHFAGMGGSRDFRRGTDGG